MTEAVSFDFLTFTVFVEMRDDVPDGFLDIAAGGCYDDPDTCKFGIWFKDPSPSCNMIVHECWHLYMSLMSYIDHAPHTFEELNSEIYAYSFQLLYGQVLDIIYNSKHYKAAEDV